MTASHSAAPHSQRRARGVSRPVATRKEFAASATPAEPTTSYHAVRVVAVSRFDEAGIGTQLARPPRVTFRDAGPRLVALPLTSGERPDSGGAVACSRRVHRVRS